MGELGQGLLEQLQALVGFQAAWDDHAQFAGLADPGLGGRPRRRRGGRSGFGEMRGRFGGGAAHPFCIDAMGDQVTSFTGNFRVKLVQPVPYRASRGREADFRLENSSRIGPSYGQPVCGCGIVPAFVLRIGAQAGG